jgi:hypothetical protein
MRIGTVLVIILFSILVVQSETVILHANQDVLFRKNYQTTNYDGYPEGLEFGSKTNSNGQYRNLINWDLSAIPSNAMVTAAKVIINIGKKVCAGGNCLAEDELDLFRVTSKWDETAATWIKRLPNASWTKPGSDYDPIRVGSVHISSTNKYQIDLTQLVQGWVDGTFPQYGVMGEARNYDNTTVWVGGAHDGAWYPACQLIVTYDLSTSAGFITQGASRIKQKGSIQKIYDIHGRLVQTGNTGSLKLPAGIYLVKLSDTRRPCFKKILILH